MARGAKAELGDTYIAANGYHYTKAALNGHEEFRLTHHILAEQELGRPLREDERVVFLDGNRSNLDPDNIAVRVKGKATARRRLAQLEARKLEIEAEIELVTKDLVS